MTDTSMEEDLKQAISHNAFQINWMPVLETATEHVVAFEALVRWNRPGVGNIVPDIFLKLAEKLTLIENIDRWVLHYTCQAAQSWEKPLGLSVNISPSWLETERVSKTIESALSASGLAPSRLQIEFSEQGNFGPSDLSRKELSRIRALGVKLVLDDFGTGSQALERLIDLPFTQIKLDRKLIHRIGKDSRVDTVVRCLLHLAHSLDMTCCAEGVETEEQLGFLDAHGCEEIQGFLIGRPAIAMPFDRPSST